MFGRLRDWHDELDYVVREVRDRGATRPYPILIAGAVYGVVGRVRDLGKRVIIILGHVSAAPKGLDRPTYDCWRRWYIAGGILKSCLNSCVQSEMKSHLKRAGIYCLLVLVVFWLGFRLICEFWPVPVFVVKERVLRAEEITATAKAFNIDEAHVSKTTRDATAWRDAKEKPVSAGDLRRIRAKLAWGWSGYLPTRIGVVDSNSVEVLATVGKYYKKCTVVRREGRWVVSSEASGMYCLDSRSIMDRVVDWLGSVMLGD
ncbi:hypothetical protein [Pedosphaera parvula]|uniref:Uncharacterized protein n=1 Tax=Pedosphaera parvula (strain Ellin514) TaxID=320771 RepID=B9XCP6_PEDPL|nr:hypothetical protein [Pedosphaera parvula]EEF62242.1 hypothetical protein Cflav_PD4877 [Pedosphaera parvula Ellin514]